MTTRPLLILALLAALLVPAAAGASELLPRPAGIEPNVQFWIRIYSQVASDAGLIHDSRNLDVIYEQIPATRHGSRRAQDRRVKAARQRYERILRTLASGKRKHLSPDEARVLDAWPEGVSNATLKEASRRVRFQRGQADKFRAGLIRGGRWRAYIDRTLQELGLPAELAALPHVESSYNANAYSHVGAAGLWQFMRGTGRRFMRVDHVVDERMDPYRATVAAARLLQQNHQTTGAWPLAITAYNHGAAGMRRAVRKLGTKDIATIVHKYRSRTFGFASRNFYSEFLAALEVDQNAEKYFGKLVPEAPVEYEEIELPYYTKASSLARALGVSTATLREANPSLRPSVWSGEKHVPKKFRVRMLRTQLERPLDEAIASLPKAQRFASQTRDRSMRVRRGDTLSSIAARHGTSVRQLMAVNNLRSRHRIRAGQTLKLPTDGRASQTLAAAPVETADLPGDGVYVVQRGDTLSKIASRFGVTEHQLARRNRLRNRHQLAVGQRLQVVNASASQLAASEASTRTARSDAEPANAAPDPVLARVEAVPAPESEGTPAPDPIPAEPEVIVPAQALAAAETPPEAATIEADDAADVFEAADAFIEATDEAADDEAGVEIADSGNPASIARRGAAPIEALDDDDLIDAPGETDALEMADADAAPADASDAISIARDALLADPSDYSVAADGSVEVQATETLGHIAEWLDVRASQIRRLNGLRYGEPIRVARRLRLDFSRVSRDVFEERRLDHHRSIQAAFFEQFEIAGTEVHVVRRGDSIWVLSRHHQVPLWLLRQYNPDIDFASLGPGTEVTLPLLRSHGLPADAADTADSVDASSAAGRDRTG